VNDIIEQLWPRIGRIMEVGWCRLVAQPAGRYIASKVSGFQPDIFLNAGCPVQYHRLLWASHGWLDPHAMDGWSLLQLQERLSEVLEQVLDENSPRWITGVKLTRLTMGDKVKHLVPPRWVCLTY
jgi:hypothetical protein